jgi:AcrR family transcriptional regulator
MARRPRQRSRKSGNGNGGSQTPESGGANGVEAAGPRRARTATNRGKIIEAFMELLGERPIETIDFIDIASRAGVSMADMRGEFGSKLAILAAHVKDIDREVLSGDRTDMGEEPPRERLFDVLMRRLEVQEPYKDAIRSLLRSARANPGLACALNSLALRSQRWMLAGADIPSSGPLRTGALDIRGRRRSGPCAHYGAARSCALTRRMVGRPARQFVPARSRPRAAPALPLDYGRGRRRRAGSDLGGIFRRRRNRFAAENATNRGSRLYQGSRVQTLLVVIAGLDPAIHRSENTKIF